MRNNNTLSPTLETRLRVIRYQQIRRLKQALINRAIAQHDPTILHRLWEIDRLEDVYGRA